MALRKRILDSFKIFKDSGKHGYHDYHMEHNLEIYEKIDFTNEDDRFCYMICKIYLSRMTINFIMLHYNYLFNRVMTDEMYTSFTLRTRQHSLTMAGNKFKEYYRNGNREIIDNYLRIAMRGYHYEEIEGYEYVKTFIRQLIDIFSDFENFDSPWSSSIHYKGSDAEIIYIIDFVGFNKHRVHIWR